MTDAEEIKYYQFRQLVKLLPQSSFVDLACGGCHYTRILLGEGLKVLAFDNTRARVPEDCEEVFELADVTAMISFPGDVVICAGILYHLPLTVQIPMVERMRGKVVLLDTHFTHLSHRYGPYRGVVRPTTASSQTQFDTAFVHTIDSLYDLFVNHTPLQLAPFTFERGWFLMIPKEQLT
jgi:hypothetical protein